MSDNDKNRKPRTEKTIKQKIASAQMRLNRLKSKEKSLSKSAETRLKIILGAEVAKAVGCKVEEVDKELILGLILQSSNISAEDKARLKLRGGRFLEDMVGRQE
ncbi:MULTISPECIES: conjugal transfer protein TraD [Enterobacterales]|uniref:Conjugal transfer protein TraD n=1 Tax=Brenneria izbisi TaxID=2939450 RepID=A0AA41XZQ7_9GAMM|nr:MULTISPECIES: conjugal transfer protein TraD [Enterobacterales]EDV0208332.1 conjugal transfer protein TraD [Salmonella enterica subsp. enterica serovar Bonariensis]ELP9601389.1 conjugal transfer protein TraD [Salmonella enterica]ASM08031.1 conjugal transfer TraD family protein [Serratia marcescens]MCV9880573.1 conjugal transfer protein TraD [Brenneria izbisi]MCV9883990.1 conjugal transfer protein TraD [Brenneria izbisi]